MTLSTPVLLGLFLLCCTGCADRACGRLSLRPGYAAALSLLAALLSGVMFQPWRWLSVLPVSLLLALAAACFARFSFYGLLTAFSGAALGWLMQTVFPAFSEPCLFTAVPTALLAALFLRSKREGLAAVLLSPLLAGGFTALSDWYLFDAAVVGLGSAGQLDAQACGALLFGALLSAPEKLSAPKSGFHQNEA